MLLSDGLDRVLYCKGELRSTLRALVRSAKPALLIADDACVSPIAEKFAESVLAARADLCARGGAQPFGASLSTMRFRPGTRIPFVPMPDGFDTYFGRPVPAAASLFWPESAEALLGAWAGSSDLGIVTALVRLEGYLIIPRAPLAFDGGSSPTECTLLAQGFTDWRMAPPSEAIAVYDERWELADAQARKLIGREIAGSLTVDLWGESRSVSTDFLLSSRPCLKPLAQYKLELVPPEANLCRPSSNGFFSLGAAESFLPMPRQATSYLARHATRYNAYHDYIGQFLGPLKKVVALFQR